MNKSLSSSFRSVYANEYDEMIAERVKNVRHPNDDGTAQKARIWHDWNIEFMGTVKMIQGTDETAILSKSDIVIRKLKNCKVGGKLTLSMIPKFKSTQLAPICDELLLRAQNMNYHPIVRLNLTATRCGANMMRILVNTIFDHYKYPYLQWINFTQCGLTSTPPKIKKNAAQQMEEEKETDLFGLDVCSLLAAGLAKNKTLKFLFLNKNPKIGANGLEAILHSIKAHPSLRKLLYNSNRLTMQHSKVLSTFFAANPNLPRIEMEQCAITDAMFIEIVNGLSQNQIVFELKVPNNEIGDDGVAALSNKVLLNANTNLMRLDLRNNYVTMKGAECLSNALAVNWTIVELDLSSQYAQKFDDEAVNLLCKGLERNESLYCFRCGDNSLTSAACYGFGRLLKYHPNLAKLELFNNKQIGAAGFRLLGEGLAQNSRIRLLNLGGTSPGDEGGMDLSKALRKQYKTTTTLIAETKQSLSDCSAIKAAITENKEKGNSIAVFSADLIDAIVAVFVGYTILEKLDIKNCYPELHARGADWLIAVRHVWEKDGHHLDITW